MSSVLSATRAPTPPPADVIDQDGDSEMGLGWFISSDHGDELAWKSGATGGFRTFIGFSTISHQGSIALSNAHYLEFIDLGMNLINPEFRPIGIRSLFGDGLATRH